VIRIALWICIRIKDKGLKILVIRYVTHLKEPPDGGVPRPALRLDGEA
jgi:hypothetical protein